jgi:hypothetical protein
VSATLTIDSDQVRVHPQDGQPQALRIRPVPRSEPLTDDEQGPGTVPTDLATGVQVRRAAAPLRAAGSGPAEAGDAGPDRTGAAGAGRVHREGARTGLPAVLLLPATITTVVAPPLHMPPPGASPQPTAAGRPGVAGAPGGALPDGSSTARSPGTEVPHDASPHLSAEIISALPPAQPTVDPSAPTSASELRRVARRLLGTCVEVLAGFRPLAQLRPYCAPERFEAIANRLLRPVGAGRGHGATRSSIITQRLTTGPGRPALPARQERIVVRRVQICDVMEGVAEIAVVLAGRNKVWAMAMRMERTRGRWQCMHLEVL